MARRRHLWLGGLVAFVLLTGLGTTQAQVTDGNVGIGTANPQEKLHVVGNVRFECPDRCIGGHANNNVAAGVVGASISGGGDTTVGPNRVTDDFGTVGGGTNNRAGNDAGTSTDRPFATVGGGVGNRASGNRATVGGGFGNTASGTDATVGGGFENTASGSTATVSGGSANTASGPQATVGGGGGHTVSGPQATVAGGAGNTASSNYATVAGGESNTASGNHASVPGGVSNTAQGARSFAAGNRAMANHDGAFVWGDNSGANIGSPGANTFSVRASGGMWFGATSSPAIGANRFLDTSTGGFLSTGGVWTDVSDHALKEDFEPVDRQVLLERVAALPITTWTHRAEDPAIRHIGPTAQDFYAAFGLGEDDRHISALDANGVALTAIQRLYALVQEQEMELAVQRVELRAQHEQISALRDQYAALEARLVALARLLDRGSQDTSQRLAPAAGATEAGR
jgi:hypothetical protein